MICLLAGWFFLSDAGHVLSGPARWNGWNWATAAGVAGAGVGLFFLDEPARDLVTSGRNDDLLSVADKLDYAGEGLWLSAGLVCLSGAGLASGNSALADAGIVGLESWVLASGLNLGVKYLAGRARPFTGEGAFSYHMFASDEDHHSFASGHTVVAFAGLSGFGFRTGNPWITVSCLALATGVAWARVYQDAHWTSDVFWGAALGTAVGYALASNHRKTEAGLCFEGGRLIYRF